MRSPARKNDPIVGINERCTSGAVTLGKVVVRVIQVPMRRPIVARLGEFTHFPYILTDVLTKEGVIGHSYLEPYRLPRPNRSSLSSRTWRNNSAAKR
jgi:hypothetical protein